MRHGMQGSTRATTREANLREALQRLRLQHVQLPSNSRRRRLRLVRPAITPPTLSRLIDLRQARDASSLISSTNGEVRVRGGHSEVLNTLQPRTQTLDGLGLLVNVPSIGTAKVSVPQNQLRGDLMGGSAGLAERGQGAPGELFSRRAPKSRQQRSRTKSKERGINAYRREKGALFRER